MNVLCHQSCKLLHLHLMPQKLQLQVACSMFKKCCLDEQQLFPDDEVKLHLYKVKMLHTKLRNLYTSFMMLIHKKVLDANIYIRCRYLPYKFQRRSVYSKLKIMTLRIFIFILKKTINYT